MRVLPHPDQAGVRVPVVAVPEAAVARLLGQVPEGLGDELDGRRRVGHEDEVKVLGVRAEELQRLGADLVNDISRALCRKVFRVGILQVNNQKVSDISFRFKYMFKEVIRLVIFDVVSLAVLPI